jgi:hypothetical protein
MPTVIGLLSFLLASAGSCSQQQMTVPNGLAARESVIAWPADWSRHMGQTVTVEGTAANAKLGALLEGKDGEIWIDDLHSWPADFDENGSGSRAP